MKPFIRYIKSLWFPVIIVSILSLLTVAGTLYIPTLTPTIINDGVDIRDVSRESLHNTVGMVLQDTWILPALSQNKEHTTNSSNAVVTIKNYMKTMLQE